ncbi:hypothetical protein SNOG_03372 [Parastagonospora nodorum SN15]|uniref:Uncharacterized protein n=1 Tax=Phaeosphaeria nodorum (strain SN15 / ATCC MYA-4574 / FGSC 10173) TaxID=321614 RepID=Q0UXZ2_PHANO|nr:hypothetical protein SNOG_03372 [Parastagonospora nodorum SN15]EAT88577.1 hypothetical protein SNOG_03372 [Parastagonospora nodorum SN15]
MSIKLYNFLVGTLPSPAHRLQAIENLDASCVVDAAKCCVPHGFYLVDLAHPGRSRKNQAFHSFLNDLERCNTLRIKLYNILPGNTNATTHEANSAACQSAHYHPSAAPMDTAHKRHRLKEENGYTLGESHVRTRIGLWVGGRTQVVSRLFVRTSGILNGAGD